MADAIPLIAGVLSAGSGIYTSVENNQQARAAEAQRTQQYNKLNSLTNDPNILYKNIAALKQDLTSAEKKMITDSVTAQMINSGMGSSPGLIQEAVDAALLQADNQRWQEAQQAYLSAVGMPANVLRGQPPAGLMPTTGSAAGAFSGGGINSLAAQLQKILTARNNPGMTYTGSGWSDPNSAFSPTGSDSTAGYAGAESAVPIDVAAVQ